MDWQVMIEDKDLLNVDMLDILSPFNGEVVGKVVNANKSQVHEVLNRVFQFHCDLSAKEREAILLKTALYIEKHKDSLSMLISSVKSPLTNSNLGLFLKLSMLCWFGVAERRIMPYTL